MSCSPRSLKLLEMPLLCKKLGFDNTLDDERITGLVDFGYNDKVLVGNWLKRRHELNNKEEDKELDLMTVYRQDYKGVQGRREQDDIWKNRIFGQGSIELKQGRDDEFMDSMATVYDLAFRCRARDFVDGDYGNATNYGKKECKRESWEGEGDERLRRARHHTEYRDAFRGRPCATHRTS